MKTIYKSKLLGTLGILSLVVPMMTFAAPDVSENNFCATLDVTAQKITTELNNHSALFGDKLSKHLGKLAERRHDRDDKRSTHRDQGDTKHDARFAVLMAKADTDAKKTAVTVFQSTTEIAIAKRKTALDAAVAAFRSGVDNLITTKGVSLDTAITNFKAAIAQAVTVAKTSCASGTDSKTARENFKATVKTAREAFQNVRTDSKIKTGVQALAATRKQAIDAAMTEFKATMNQAKAALKTAFAE